MHVKTEPAGMEQSIVTQLRNLLPMMEEFENMSSEERNDLLRREFEEMSSEERSRVIDLLQQLQAVCIGASITESILLFTHVLTTETLQSVREMYESGQLTVIIRDLFRCLAKDENLTVEVQIGAELFKECEDGFADDGKY